MKTTNFEERVRACYSTWGATYYDDFLGKDAPYPPVHVKLLKRWLRTNNARRILDVGCGPASFLRELRGKNLDLYGFDLTPEMVAEARRIFSAKGLNPKHIWEGSVLQRAAYTVPGEQRKRAFDAAVCVGVLPHVPAEADVTVIKNIHAALKPGGALALEARNQLFALFTLNRYSHEFFLHDLIHLDQLEQSAGSERSVFPALRKNLTAHFRVDMPPIRRGKQQEPGYDEVLSRTHNPFIVREQVEKAGFRDVEVLFYHWHSLPPLYGAAVPYLFRRASVALENNPTDWRGYFMASAFIVTRRKI